MNPEEIRSSSEDIKSGKGTNVGFQASLKRLQISRRTALSSAKKKKTLDKAEELSTAVESRIKSVALNKFAVRKAQRLKALGKTKSEVDSLVADLAAGQGSLLSRGRSSLAGLGIDQKFVGLSAAEILEKVNAIPKDPAGSAKPSSGSSGRSSGGTKKPKGSSGNGLYNEATPDFSGTASAVSGGKKKSMKVRTNPDTDTKEDIEQNNERIYDYLVKSGEVDIANYILDLMTRPKMQDQMKVSEIRANTKELSKLSDVNEDIYKKLDELQEGLEDEQDTSISIQKKLKKRASGDTVQKSGGSDKDGAGFFEAIVRMILGGTMVDLLKNSGGILGFAKTILSKAWGWLSKKITGLVGPLISSVKEWASKKLGALSKTVSGLGRALSSKLGGAWDKTLKKLGIRNADDGVKGSKTSKTPKSKKPKPTKTSKTARQIKRSKPAKKASKLSRSALGKVKPKGILRKLLRFTKPIPFLGTAIAAGTAIYSAQDGYRHADEILGKDPQKLTTTDKLASAAGALVNDVSFGVLSTRGTAEKIIEWMGKDAIGKAVEKAENQGIIETNWIGDSEVKDWTSLGALPSVEIRKIIDHDDWSDSDREKMEALYAKRKQFESSGEGSRASTPEKAETEVTSTGDMKQVSYTMQSVPRNIDPPMVPGGRQGEVPSKNPADYKISDLFDKHQVKDEDIENMHPAVLHNLKAMAAEYLDTYGEKIQVNSAFRSFEEQAKMKEKYGDKAAAPGSSMHNYGVAVDMNTDNAQKAIAAGLFSKYGFHRPVSGETWHVEPSKIDRAAIRENGMAGTPGAAEVASSPEGSGSPEVETEGEVPEKTQSSPEMVEIDETARAREETRGQIEQLQSSITSLKERKKYAEKSGNRRAARAAEIGIKAFERRISNLRSANGIGANGQALGKEDVSKDRQIQNSDGVHRAGVASTRAYDQRMAVVVPGGQGGINNVNNTIAGQQGNAKPSDMFKH